MLILTAKNLELRGVAHKLKKDGSPYYLLNVEDNEGNPYQFYCKDSDCFAKDLQRGAIVDVTFIYRKYERDIFLSVQNVSRSLSSTSHK